MFETAELGRTVDKKEYEARAAALRPRLLTLQQELQKTKSPVFVLVSGVDGAGKGDVVNLLHEWMDPRFLTTFAFGAPTDEERERPFYWRYWRTLAPRGRVGVYFGSWYTDPIVNRVFKNITKAEFERQLLRIRAFEEMLHADGAALVKLWFHLSKQEQAARFSAWKKSKSMRWRVSSTDLKNHKRYDRFRRVSEQALFATSTGEAPWSIIEATDDRYRNLAAVEQLASAIEQKLEEKKPEEKKEKPRAKKRPAASPGPTEKVSILSRVDLSRAVEDDVYDEKLPRLQGRLARLARALESKQRSMTVVLEGWDAAGKGGAIRRIAQALDARQYQTVPIAAPTDEERAHHYLWRFWRHIPRAGRATIYDRSWYGRVLVERVEGFAQEHEWQRSYAEINEFERQLSDHGSVVVKLWLHIDRDEQLKRFQAREGIEYKKYKITADDYRNREKWDAYVEAVNDMVERTSTGHAPWHLVAANDKRWARLDALDHICDRLEAAL